MLSFTISDQVLSNLQLSVSIKRKVSPVFIILYLIFCSYDNNTYIECVLSVKLCLVIKLVTVKN